ncbi:uncharacterized protein ARB_06616 [Trichophyton benhamiae CBS 112371]|uniref:Uncharacterized protein n=1 Tax=Arthroderma benhamiae (strain ATCC MYA-4681 / CBS 112371) TaxID=663331 RepID=D4AQV6_ARTBC|nr:uncharacterized protein ARB_06616 [Trichophyton benhamiae CBS 112371]EFE34850.1 hypothetical protein ARB_06616 [Trichophyton benhamiae CBS 112371]
MTNHVIFVTKKKKKKRKIDDFQEEEEKKKGRKEEEEGEEKPQDGMGSALIVRFSTPVRSALEDSTVDNNICCGGYL